jgi:short-subunit dehydrogenase
MISPEPARPVALITGASMGIGEAFADALAARGYALVLAARSSDALERIAARLRAAHGIEAQAIPADLRDPAAVERLVAQAEARFGRIDLLVNNAGFGAHGRFAALDGANQIDMIRLNVESLVALSHAVLPGMIARGSGGIINIGSTAAFQPVPYMAVYGATKAFVLSFSEALHEEYRARGITVLALNPGQTATNFFRVAGDVPNMGEVRTPADVVATGLRAYDARRSYVVDGVQNRVLAFSSRLLPRGVIARMSAAIMGRGVAAG